MSAATHEPASPRELRVREEKETGRVEAFSDGVFAIAITLLVLELKVPPPGRGPLGRALLEQWPSYAAFLVSFATIGIMWLNHHLLFSMIRRVDHALLIFNALLLLGVTAVPFPTALLAEHHGHPGERVAAGVYSGVFLYIAIVFNLLWRWASSPARDPSLLRVPHDHPNVLEVNSRYRFGPLFYIGSFVVSLWSPGMALAVYGALALFFALPYRRRGA